MIRITTDPKDGFFVPCFCCDVCGERITSTPLGMTVYFGDPTAKTSVPTFDVHKGFCDQLLQRKHQAEGRFRELQYHVQLLAEQVGLKAITIERAAELATEQVPHGGMVGD